MLNKSDFPCETCGYTYEDALILGDHHLCKSNNKQVYTQCESKKENPWCSNCKEKDCEVDLEGTCEMVKKYLSQTAEVERLKCENEKLKSAVNTFMWGIKTAMLSKDKITVSTKISKETFTILSEYQTENPNSEVTK